MKLIMLKIYKYNLQIYFGYNTKPMNLWIHELVNFNQTTKIDTHEEKYFWWLQIGLTGEILAEPVSKYL